MQGRAARGVRGKGRRRHKGVRGRERGRGRGPRERRERRDNTGSKKDGGQQEGWEPIRAIGIRIGIAIATAIAI